MNEEENFFPSMTATDIAKLLKRDSLDHDTTINLAIATALVADEPARDEGLKLVLDFCLQECHYSKWIEIFVILGRDPSLDELKAFFKRSYLECKLDAAEDAAGHMAEPSKTECLKQVFQRRLERASFGLGDPNNLLHPAKFMTEPSKTECLVKLMEYCVNTGMVKLALEAQELSKKKLGQKQLQSLFSVCLSKSNRSPEIFEKDRELLSRLFKSLSPAGKKKMVGKLFHSRMAMNDWVAIFYFIEFFTEPQCEEIYQLTRADFSNQEDPHLAKKRERILPAIRKAEEPFRSIAFQGLLEDSIQAGDYEIASYLRLQLGIEWPAGDQHRLLSNMISRKDAPGPSSGGFIYAKY